MKLTNRGRSRAQSGGALVITTVSLTSLAVLSLSMLSVMLARSNEQRVIRERMRAEYVCEAALQRAVVALNSGGTGAIGDLDAPMSWGDSQFWVASASPTANLRTLTATALDDRIGARVELTLQRNVDPTWRFAAFGREQLTMDSNARIDSYSTALGTSYAAQATNGSGSSAYAASNGDIGSNGAITMRSNSKVFGDASAGPSSSTTLIGNSVVTGGTTPMSSNITLPSITLPAIASAGNLTITGATTLGPGSLAYGAFRGNASSTTTIVGPATVVFQSFQLRSNASLLVNSSNGPVKIYVVDSFILNSNSQLRPLNYRPEDLELNLLSDNIIDPGVVVQLDTIEFDSNAKMYGTILAPEANIAFNSNFELFGAVMARRVHLDSNSRVHFDENLMNSKGGTPGAFAAVCWRTLPYK